MFRPLFAVLVLTFISGILLHYPQQFHILDFDINDILGLERHAIERVLFLAPVILGGLIYGLKGGIVFSALALAAMLPRVFLFSESVSDALYETVLVIITGGLINWQIDSRRKQIGQREQAIIRLETIRRELDSYVQIIMENDKRLSVINSVTTIINQSITLKDIFSSVADRIMDAIGIEVVLIYLLNEQNLELEVMVYQGVSEEFAYQVNGLKIGEGLNGWVAETGQPCLVEDSSRDARLAREIVVKEGIKSQFIVPLRSREKIVGTLDVANRSKKEFTKDERELLLLIGDELGVAVEKARLYEEAERVGRRYREIFEKAHDAIWVHDFNGNLLVSNRQNAELLGCEPEELINENVSRFLTSEGLKLAMEVKRNLLNNIEIKQPYEQRLIKKDGTEAIIMLTTSLVEYESMPAFQNIARDVTGERLLQADLSVYLHQITRAHEEERKRIARELHDDSIQVLSVLSRKIDDVASGNAISAETAGRIDDVRREIDNTIERMRLFIQDLRPPTLEYLGLIPALREMVSQFEEQAGIEVILHHNRRDWRLAPEDALLTYRIIQEALRNVWKHSNSTKAKVTIESDNDKTVVTISDNGRGFVTGEEPGFVHEGKIGLAGMRERAELLGGKLDIYSEPGRGTRVVLVIPAGANHNHDLR